MIAIIDYGASNLQSVCNALKKLNQTYKVVTKPQKLAHAKKVILPGVGAAADAMAALRKRGFTAAIRRLKIPFLGICLGMQLLADSSEEGNVKCLSIIPGRVKRFPKTSLKIPQIGWNRVETVKTSPLFAGISSNSYFYFVNSFYFDATTGNILARTPYGIQFPSVIQQGNFYATQFHPEKSGEAGLQLLRNFCSLC